MVAKDYCSRRPVTIDASASIADAAALLAREDIGCLVVTDGKRPVGMLTDRDVVFRVLLDEVSPDRDRVADAMTAPVQALPADADLDVVFTALRSHRLRRLPLVDADGALVGVLAVDDLLRLLATEIGDVAEAIRRQLGSGSSALAVPS